MELTEIRSFLAIAELGSFSKASLRLGIPQPTLSRQLGRLEEELGSPLFYRHGRGATLTETGHVFIGSVTPVIRELDRIRGEVIARGTHATSLVRFGIPPSIGRSIAASVVAAFRQECPRAKLQVVEAFSGTLAEWLEVGTIDAAILYDVRRSAHMPVTPVLKEDLFLVRKVRPGLPEAPVSITEIEIHKLILPSRGQGLRRAIELGFEVAKLPLECAMEIDSIATTKELVENSDLCAILPFGAIHREVADGRLMCHRVTASGDMTALLVTATASSQPVSRATHILLRIVGEQVSRFVQNGILKGVSGRACNVLPFEKRPTTVTAQRSASLTSSVPSS